tara:strand:+ start:1285 stop:1845 length:561 start_codon:yes stop_codon:yes gene_type:complete
MKPAREEYQSVFPTDNWTLQDYKDFTYCIREGYLVQEDSNASFIINPEWDGDDIYDKKFGDSEEEVCCVGCNIKVCGYDEEPPHKDNRDEAVCNDCWVEEEEEEEGGVTEYEVEYGDMLNEDDYGESTTDWYEDKDSAVARYNELVKENKYDSVDLVERTGVVDGCCVCSDEIMSYKKENPSYLDK